MTASRPTFAEVTELAAMVEGTVPGEFIDANGHMNVRYYQDLAGRCMRALHATVGIDDAYRESNRSMFTIEQHVRYFDELREGARYAVHPRVLEVSSVGVHLVSFIVDVTRQRLACTFETTLLHVDTSARRASEMPDSVAQGWRKHVERQSGLGWSAPTCGSMGLRR